MMENWKNRANGTKRKKLIEGIFKGTGENQKLEMQQQPVDFSKKGSKPKLHKRFSRRKLTPKKAKSSEIGRKRKAEKTGGVSRWEPQSKIGLDQINNLFRGKDSLRDRTSDRFSNQFLMNYMAIDLNKMRKDHQFGSKTSAMGGDLD